MLKKIFLSALCLSATVYSQQYAQGNIWLQKNVNDNYNAFAKTQGSFKYEDSEKNYRSHQKVSDYDNTEAEKKYTSGSKNIAVAIAIGDRFEASEKVNNKAHEATPQNKKPVSIKESSIDIKSSKTSVNLKTGLLSIVKGQIKLDAPSRSQEQRSENVKNLAVSNDINKKYRMRSHALGSVSNVGGVTSNAAVNNQGPPLLRESDIEMDRLERMFANPRPTRHRYTLNGPVIEVYVWNDGDDTMPVQEQTLIYGPNSRHADEIDFVDVPRNERTEVISFAPRDGSTNYAEQVNPGVNSRQRANWEGVENDDVEINWVPVGVFMYDWGLGGAWVSPNRVEPESWE